MATKAATNNQTSTDREYIERLVSALEKRTADASNGRRTADAQPLSAEAIAAIARFTKTALELAVLPPK